MIKYFDKEHFERNNLVVKFFSSTRHLSKDVADQAARLVMFLGMFFGVNQLFANVVFNPFDAYKIIEGNSVSHSNIFTFS